MLYRRWWTMEESDLNLHSFGKTDGGNDLAFTIVQYWNEFFQGMVLSTKQSSYPLQTYIQQMVVTLDYSSMNVEQIAQAMKLNNQSLDAAKIFIAMIPVLIIYPFCRNILYLGSRWDR